MALPRSTFVMGAVVLVLFGLAIRETVSKPAEPPVDIREDTYAAGMAQAEADARAAKLAAEREQFETQRAAVRTLYGAEVATLGMLFDGFSLGRDRSATSAVEASVEQFETRTGSTIRFGPVQGPAINSITIQLFSSLDSTDRDRLCLWLDGQLQTSWGRSSETDPAIYTNHVTHQRSLFSTSSDGCTLVFDRYLEPELWLATLGSLLGQKAETLRAATGGYMNDQTVMWEIPGLGAGTTGTSVTALTEKRRVSAIRASTSATKQTLKQMIDVLVTMYGTPKRRVTSRPSVILTWDPRELHVEIESDDDGLVTLTAREP